MSIRLDWDTGLQSLLVHNSSKFLLVEFFQERALGQIHHVDGRPEPTLPFESLTENPTLRARDVGLIPYFLGVDTSRNPLCARWHRVAQVKFDIVVAMMDARTCTTVLKGLHLVSPT